MCGRFVMSKADGDLVAAFGVDEVVGDPPPPSWNVAPTDPVRIVLERNEGDGPVRTLETVRWGLVPSWAKDRAAGSRAINARAETVLERPTFRAAAVKRRALVPAEGYYEWEARGGKKVPQYLRAADPDALLALAGLYEFWRDRRVPEGQPGEWLMTATILTRPAADALGHIHDRTPVVVPEGLRGDWLDPGLTDKDDIRTLLDSMPEPELVPVRVGAAVGNVRNNGPALIEPVGDAG